MERVVGVTSRAWFRCWEGSPPWKTTVEIKLEKLEKETLLWEDKSRKERTHGEEFKQWTEKRQEARCIAAALSAFTRRSFFFISFRLWVAWFHVYSSSSFANPGPISWNSLLRESTRTKRRCRKRRNWTAEIAICHRKTRGWNRHWSCWNWISAEMLFSNIHFISIYFLLEIELKIT